MGKPVIKVLTGQRRVGKSYLLEGLRQLCETQLGAERVVFFSAEKEASPDVLRGEGFLQWVREQAPAEGPFALLADEVQEVEGFDRALRSLLAEGRADLYCTGSNTRFLSADILGRLSGRAVEFRVWPLSYPEFLRFHQRPEGDEALAEYLQFGGLPFLRHLPLQPAVIFEYLRGVYSTILYKDVVQRQNLRNSDLLERLILFLADNVGSLVSANRIAGFLKSQHRKVSVSSVMDYLVFLDEAGFVNRVRRSDLQGKRFFEIGEKFYFTDLGLRHVLKPYAPQDLGKVLENVVYTHLRTWGWTVQTGQEGDKEIDFIAERAGQKRYLQVALALREAKTVEREFGNLLAVPDAWPKFVVSLDSLGAGQEGVRHLSLREFLRDPLVLG